MSSNVDDGNCKEGKKREHRGRESDSHLGQGEREREGVEKGTRRNRLYGDATVEDSFEVRRLIQMDPEYMGAR